MLPNLSITKHDFNLECKQTWSGNKVHTYTRVNEGVGGIREAQTILYVGGRRHEALAFK